MSKYAYLSGWRLVNVHVLPLGLLQHLLDGPDPEPLLLLLLVVELLLVDGLGLLLRQRLLDQVLPQGQDGRRLRAADDHRSVVRRRDRGGTGRTRRSRPAVLLYGSIRIWCDV